MTKLSMFCSFKYRHLVKNLKFEIPSMFGFDAELNSRVEHENLGDSKINAYLNSWILKLI